jgi:hypothetical protein
MSSVVTKTAGAYTNVRAGGAIRPEVVARTIEKALTARRPKPRYVVGGQARSILAAHALLPDRAWDSFLARQFSRPTPRS